MVEPVNRVNSQPYPAENNGGGLIRGTLHTAGGIAGDTTELVHAAVDTTFSLGKVVAKTLGTVASLGNNRVLHAGLAVGSLVLGPVGGLLQAIGILAALGGFLGYGEENDRNWWMLPVAAAYVVNPLYGGILGAVAAHLGQREVEPGERRGLFERFA